jgi:hypothetical protein
MTPQKRCNKFYYLLADRSLAVAGCPSQSPTDESSAREIIKSFFCLLPANKAF